MEEASELTEYLPLSFKTPSEQEYIAFLWDAFETNYSSGKHQFAFLAYHMLTMSFVYFNIWQIKRNRPADFMKATYGFTKDNEDTMISASSPFTFSEIGESAIFRFLKLVDCDNGKIGTYTKLVKDRNAAAHPNGVIHFSDRRTLDTKIAETLRVVDEIQNHSKCVIEDCYRSFLLGSNNPEDREYPDDMDQIREVLIHEHYLSQKDIEICAGFDWTAYEDQEMHTNYPGIESLHRTLRATYTES
jgi:hypothetical protein